MEFSIDESFGNKRFLLGEATLKPLVELVSKWLQKTGSSQQIMYRVTRSDKSEYLAKDFGDLLKEVNTGHFQVQSLHLESIPHEALRFQLTFRKTTHIEPVSLQIWGERDFVMPMGADLRDHIESEILVSRLQTRWFAGLILICLFFLVRLLIQARPTQKLPSLDNILKSQDIQEKLNYLILARVENEIPLPLGIAMLVVVMVGLLTAVWLMVINPQFDVLRPGNLFLFGKEHKRYTRILDIRSKFVWAGLVALIVSVVAGFIVWHFTQ